MIANQKGRPTAFSAELVANEVKRKELEISGGTDEDYERFEKQIKECLINASEVEEHTSSKRLSDETLSLMRKRREMIKNGYNKIENNILCRLIRKRIPEDYVRYR